ncbi:isochorismatase family protein [Candidatus Entotheonella palauensis]|nr:isochorismatase family protein [Candidatus Entotheonella palauensis]
MTDIYEAKGYGELTIGFGTKLAILVVDFQRGFVDPSFQLGGGPMMEGAISRTAELLSVARQHRVPVANCYVAYPSAAAAPHWKIKGVAQEFRRDSQEAALDPRIVDFDYDYVFEKSGASAFFQTPLAAYFVKHGVDTVAITGCVTSGCIRASAVDSFQYGFRTMLVEDCSSDNDPQPHLDTLRDVGRRYADIVKAQEVIAQIKSQVRAGV